MIHYVTRLSAAEPNIFVWVGCGEGRRRECSLLTSLFGWGVGREAGCETYENLDFSLKCQEVAGAARAPREQPGAKTLRWLEKW